MKKGILCAAAALLMLCMVIGASALTPAADGYVYDIAGDISGDGALTLRDAIGILRCVVSGSVENTDAADANQDGRVTAQTQIKTER